VELEGLSGVCTLAQEARPPALRIGAKRWAGARQIAAAGGAMGSECDCSVQAAVDCTQGSALRQAADTPPRLCAAPAGFKGGVNQWAPMWDAGEHA